MIKKSKDEDINLDPRFIKYEEYMKSQFDLLSDLLTLISTSNVIFKDEKDTIRIQNKIQSINKCRKNMIKVNIVMH